MVRLGQDMKAYKYFHSRYRTSISMGLYYVNTFDNIRTRYENGLISDPTEGVVKNLSGDLLIGNSSDPKYQKTIRDLDQLRAIRIEGDCSNIFISNNSFKNHVRNSHMFCVTTERNDSYWQNLPTTQGGPYDSCLEIFDFVEFSRRLAHALATRYAVFGNLMVNKCFFEANSGTIADGTTKLPSYFRKPEADDFKKQFEARAVLVPYQAQALVPRTFYLNVSDLVSLVG